MKKYKLILGLPVIIFTMIFTNCKEDLLPKSNLLLDIAKDLKAEAGYEMVSLSWEIPQNDNLKNFILSWSQGGEPLTLDNTQNSYVIKGLENGMEYTFTVRGDYGEIGKSGGATVKVKPIDELSFTALPGNKFAVLTWSKPKRDDLVGYKITWTPGGETGINLGADKTSYTVSGLTNDTEYTFNFSCVFQENTPTAVYVKKITPGEVNAFVVNNTPIFKDGDVSFSYNPAYLPASNAVSWAWDFGDGTTSTEQNPNHTFTKGGKYQVSLSIKDDQGTEYSDTKELKVLGEIWSFVPQADMKTSSPAIAEDGTIYAGDVGGYLYAFNPDGTEKWRFLCGVDGDDIYGGCPAIGADGTIYVGSDSKNMYAINPDGTKKWSFATGNKIFGSASIASDGTIVFGSRDGNVYALNTDGSQKWVFTTGGEVKSSPAIDADGIIYIGSFDDNVYAINPDGTEKWRVTTGGDVESNPVIGVGGMIYFGSADNKFYAVNKDGAISWTFDFAGEKCIGNAVVDNQGTVYVGARDKIFYAFNSDGSVKWKFTGAAKRFLYSSASIDANGIIYTGNEDGGLYALDMETGDLKWDLNFVGSIFSSPTIGSNGELYFGIIANNGASEPKFYSVFVDSEGPANTPWPMKRYNAKQTGSIQ